MQGFAFTFLFILFSPILLAQENILKATSRVDEVTVYLNGAEVRSSYEVLAKKGRNILTLQGHSPYLQDKSAQISGGGSVELISVSIRNVSARMEDVSIELKLQYDSIGIVKQKIELINNQIDANNAEKDVLTKNQYIGGSQSGVSVSELARAADFFRDRTLKINNVLTTLNWQLAKLSIKLDSLEADFEREKSKLNFNRKDVVVVFSSPTDQKVNFESRYLVANTGWAAGYDLISEDVNKPVVLKYKGKVYNNTGIDWKDVKLVLSSADPTLGASRPYLTAWTLNYTSRAFEGLLENRVMGVNVIEEDSTVSYDEVAVELSASFPIAAPQDIPSDANPYLIDISTSSVDAAYEYLTIPKVDLSAFLIAKITGWEKLNLIDGMANVYFGNTYIGESKIDTRLISDTLELSLGRDNQILITRAKVEDTGGAKFLGTRRVESFVYDIQVKNNRKVPVLIKIQDQVPVSQESDIVVDVEDISGATRDIPSGRLQWIRTLNAGDNIKYRVAFSVRYPKGRNVAIRQQRVVRTPRYRQ